MTIRSIDMQVLVQKVNDVGKIQNAYQQENNARQQENANQIVQQTVKNTQTVSQSVRSESALIHEKEEKEKKSKKKMQKKGDSENTENNRNSKQQTTINRVQGRNIDIIA